MRKSNLAQILFCASLLVIATACGGGGDGASPPPVSPPPPPPPPVNNLPDVSIATPYGTTADERQTLVLDARGSTDADGDSLTFQWTQTAGPAAQILSPDNALTDIVLPEVSADSELAFQVAVSDGKGEATATQALTANNIDLQPRFSGTAVSEPTIAGSNPTAVRLVKRVFGAEATPDATGLRRSAGGGVEVFLKQGSAEGFGPDTTVATTFTGLDGRFAAIAGNLYGETQTYEIAFASEHDDLIQIFERDDEDGTAPPNLSLLSNVAVTAPCGLAFGIGRVAPTDPALSTVLVVGKAGGGIQLFAQGPGSPDPLDRREFRRSGTVTNAGTFCDVASVWAPIPMLDVFLDFIVGVDTETHRIRTFAPAVVSMDRLGPFVEHDTTNIRRGPAGMLEITDTEISAQVNGRVAPLEVAVLLAAPEHDGTHMVEVYRWNRTFSAAPGATYPAGILQFDLEESLAWTKGRPKKLISQDVTGDGENDIIVLLESAPYLVIFRREVDYSTLTTTGFSGPEYIEVGFDFDDLTQQTFDWFTRSVMLTRKEAGELVSVQTYTAP